MADGRSLMEPDFDLSDVDAMTTEVRAAAALGLGAVVDAMPCDAGRNAGKLAELSRRTGVHVVAPTGLHHERFYGPAHWSHRVRGRGPRRAVRRRHRPTGSTSYDYSGPVVRRTAPSGRGHQGRRQPRRAVATRPPRVRGGRRGASTDRRPDPHPLRGRHRRARAGPACSPTCGVDPSHVVLSHVDKVVDRDYHREMLRDRRVRRVRPVVPLGRRAERDARAARVAGRGRPARPGRPRHGCRATGLLPRLRRPPGLGWLLDGFSAEMEAFGLDDDGPSPDCS